MRWVVAITMLAGCDTLFLGAERIDASPNPTDISNLQFGNPMPITSANTAADEDRPTLTDDLLELYFHRGTTLMVVRRASADADFGPAEPIPELNDGANVRACISGDGLRIYFSRLVASYDIFFSKRASRTMPWSAPVYVAELSTTLADYCGQEREDHRVIYGSSDAANVGFTAWISKRADANAAWGPREPLTDLNSELDEGAPWGDRDAAILVFDRRDGDDVRVHQATRQGTAYAVRELSELVPAGEHASPWLSRDGRILVYAVGDSLGDLYMATR